MEYDPKYMRRALQLAANSPEDTHSNPMVGAVIVHNGRIIGEGWHRKCGEGHAEVNAIASVADPSLLPESTMYVTLEPCSHYGKTPPCAKLLIDKQIPRVVVGAVDPFEKVAGRGIQMLRDAGVEVVSGVLADECRKLNEKFFTAHSRRRPYVTIKWAQSADGFMDIIRTPDEPPFRFSNDTTTMLTHRERARHDAILTTAATFLADRPALTTRAWSGPNPRRIIFDRSSMISRTMSFQLTNDSRTMSFQLTTPAPPSSDPIHLTTNNSQPTTLQDFELITGPLTIDALLERLYDEGITSVLVEAGPRFLQAIIDAGAYDNVRIETTPVILGSRGAHPSPHL